MAAMWEVAGMMEDKYGVGFFRAAVITKDEVTLPSLQDKGVVSISCVELSLSYVKITSPSKLKIHPIFDVLYNEVTGKKYIRESSGVWHE